MLILTRRVGENILIGDSITATVLAVKGHQVRIGISAPPEVRVLREELVDPDRPGLQRVSSRAPGRAGGRRDNGEDIQDTQCAGTKPAEDWRCNSSTR